MAIPDYDAGINVLREFIKNIDKKLELNAVQNNDLINKKEEYSKLIAKLEEMQEKQQKILKQRKKN